MRAASPSLCAGCLLDHLDRVRRALGPTHLTAAISSTQEAPPTRTGERPRAGAAACRVDRPDAPFGEQAGTLRPASTRQPRATTRSQRRPRKLRIVLAGLEPAGALTR